MRKKYDEAIKIYKEDLSGYLKRWSYHGLKKHTSPGSQKRIKKIRTFCYESWKYVEVD